MRTAVWMAGEARVSLVRSCSWTNWHTHVQATGDAGALEGLLGGVLLTGGHETGHLLLGELNLATTEGREVDVGDLVLLGGLGRHGCGVVGGGVVER